MKLQYKHQKFQADAAKAVVDVFAGQPYLTPTYMIDQGYVQNVRGEKEQQLSVPDGKDYEIREDTVLSEQYLNR